MIKASGALGCRCFDAGFWSVHACMHASHALHACMHPMLSPALPDMCLMSRRRWSLLQANCITLMESTFLLQLAAWERCVLRLASSRAPFSIRPLRASRPQLVCLWPPPLPQLHAATDEC